MFSEELNRFVSIRIDIEKERLASVLTDSISKAFQETARSGWELPQGFTIQKIIDAHGEFINSFSDSVWNSHVLAVKEFNLPANEDLIKDIKKSLEFYLSNLNIDWYRTLTTSGHSLPEDVIESGNEEIEKIKYGAYITKIREAELFVIELKQKQTLQSKAPESLQNIIWLFRYGWQYKWYLLIALFALIVSFSAPILLTTLMSEAHQIFLKGSASR